MRRLRLFGSRAVVAAVCLACCLFSRQARLFAENASSAYQEVRGLIDQARYLDAERLIRAYLLQNTNDPTGVGLLALILDFEGRHDEAEHCFQNGLAMAPDSAFLLNNLGRHYVPLQRFPQARDAFAKVLARDPSNTFALIELAQLDLNAGKGGSALDYLNRLPGAAVSNPSRASLYFSAGLLLAEGHHYREAQQAFAHALDADPASFNIQYNLGIASAEAGDLDRAREIFEHALTERSNDVDCMLQLALVYQRKRDFDRSLAILMRATLLAPKRLDVLRAIALTTEDLGLYGDTARAWDHYLQVQPDDDIARRERGFALASANELTKGLEDLRWFQRRHPRNVEGLYELAIAEGIEQPDRALEHLNTAVHDRPDSLPARYARASLEYQHGNLQQAREDAEYVVNGAPQNLRAIDLLARIDLRANHPEHALELLAGGLKRAPDNPQLLLHYSQVLQRLGRASEAAQAGARLRTVRSKIGQAPPGVSLFDLYAKSPGTRSSQ